MRTHNKRPLFSILTACAFLLLSLIPQAPWDVYYPTGQASAQTNVGGAITTDTTWTLSGSPYIVTGSVLVNNGVTLTIEPGVAVKFNNGKALQVNGELIARGTETNKIIFTSNQVNKAPGDWSYILFSDSSVDATFNVDGNYAGGSILEFCIIEFAGSNKNAVHIDKSSPYIGHCSIRDSSSRGIYAERSSRVLKINNNDILRNAGGIYSSPCKKGISTHKHSDPIHESEYF